MPERSPLIVDGISFASAIPQAELALYSSPSVGTAGLDEASQAAAYASALTAVACRSTVVEVMLGRLVDGPGPGAQSGLFYADGTPKTSLAAVTEAASTAQGVTRGCATALAPASAVTAPPPVVKTPPAPSGSKPTKTTPAVPAPKVQAAATAVASAGQLVFPASVRRTSPPSVHLGCTAACLYLVTLERAGDGAPVLARRGAIPAAGARTVTLPKAPLAAGRYRFSVWIVGQNPGPITVDQSPVVSAT